MKSLRQITELEVKKACEELLFDCILKIKFEINPFVVIFEFVSYIQPTLITLKCSGISKFNMEKNANDDAYYTILEVSLETIEDMWELRILPEVDISITCLDLSIQTKSLSETDLKKIGLIE